MEPTSTQGNKNMKGYGVLAAVVAVLIILGIIFLGKKSSTQTPVVTPAVVIDTSATSTNTNPPSSGTAYKDGTYTSEGAYNSPAGSEKIQVSLTLAHGVVTDATVVSEATFPESKRFQTIFVSNFKQYVVGKDIATLNLDRVAGSSLTPQGFNDAVAKIKVQAQG